ncbi:MULTISPECIES: sigma-70 family RNA polymerase sigma factor [Nocardiopsidaceae]|uniref:Sigma-70 family RNA polymerase sigma factor n=2 Tax=Nocardiopsidaceae TaxID=83676 RepID=A0ABY6YVS6_9ACTN|nr:sigma-70 family RNA polymerase sigma factor [Streptomonospora nanhaiensis]MEE2043209.1 sigma-70 family RNA polymerase sigma factor [Nocardiopsis tropica]WAE76390.1 sigma-70 family RNA polymerase sigma factor [Streptomonospora nanhaiensis]
MNTAESLAARFHEHRGLLHSIAHRMLGSRAEAEDAVQETWLKLSRTDASQIDNLAAWLTTVTGRVCLDLLRSRSARREDPAGEDLPEPAPAAAPAPDTDPEHQAVLSDTVGTALMVVLDTLSPAERLAFVLHDMFALPFEEIAPVVERSPAATRQLASRARRRVRGGGADGRTDLARRREVVDAFLAAARGGDFEALLRVLAPDVVVRPDTAARLAGVPAETRGARAVASQAITFARLAEQARPALVRGLPGFVSLKDGRPYAALAFTVHGDRITGFDVLYEPELLAGLA